VSFSEVKLMADIREVARRAQVSLGTVSNVLNHPELVSEETRIRVQRTIDELGFVRNGSARQLRVGSTQSIGLVVLDVTNPFFTEVARGAEDAASEHGYIVILCNSDNSPRKEKNYLRVLEEQRVAGILIVPVDGNADYARTLHRSGTSLALLDRVSEDVNTCSVSVDDVFGGELAGRRWCRARLPASRVTPSRLARSARSRLARMARCCSVNPSSSMPVISINSISESSGA
jgi:LacI family transcriptional regulator